MDGCEGTAGGGRFQTPQTGLILWQLPKMAVFGGKSYEISSDYRDILEIFAYWDDPDLPDFAKWQIALALFYQPAVPEGHHRQAMEFLADFIRGGHRQERSGTKLLDWQQDAPLIVADINKVAGCEVRALGYVHWWTFLSWFHGIGQGQLSQVVAIRDKLAKGTKLDSWESSFYRDHAAMVKLPKRLSNEEMQQRAYLQRLLEGRNDLG